MADENAEPVENQGQFAEESSNSTQKSVSELASNQGNAVTERTQSGIDNSETAQDEKTGSAQVKVSEKEMKPPAPSKTAPKTKEKERTKEKEPDLAYKEPSWSAVPTQPYSLEVLKNGCIISTINLSEKAFHVVGRLPSCDISMEHPSVSRHHAIFQYKRDSQDERKSGYYLYDMGSTHGTFVNKAQVKAKTFYRLKVGFVVKFAGSSRLFILQGPQEEEEEEEEEDNTMVTTDSEPQVGKGDVMTAEEFEKWKQERHKKIEEEGIDWGMGEDAEPEEQFNMDDSESVEKPDLVLKDPKKTLRGFFEREGLELEYEVEEKGPGHAKSFHARVKLPIENSAGESLYAEAVVQGKKREAVLAVALEACKILDMHGLLRQSAHESRKVKVKNYEENDYYDSDDDTFLDRTGSVEKKRLTRMKKAGKNESSAETHESLVAKLHSTQEQIQELEKSIKKKDKGDYKGTDTDSLDAFMSDVDTLMDKSTKLKIKRQIFELRKEEKRLEKLVSITAPSSSLLKLQSESLAARSSSVKTEGQVSSESQTRTEDTRELETSPDKTSAEFIKPTLPPHSPPPPSLPPPSLPPPLLPPPRPSKRPLSSTVESSTTPEADSRQESGHEAQESAQPGEKRPLEEPPDSSEKSKKKKKKTRVYSAPTEWEAVNDPSFSEWTPPLGQTGDGKTSLNAKFGY